MMRSRALGGIRLRTSVHAILVFSREGWKHHVVFRRMKASIFGSVPELPILFESAPNGCVKVSLATLAGDYRPHPF